MDKFITFCKKHYILANLALMCVAVVVLVAIAMWMLRIWTGHGNEIIVPQVTSMTLTQADDILERADLHAEVVDSIFSDEVEPGHVIAQVPPAGDKVKPGRYIYLTINAFSPKQVALPDLSGMSLRQAQSTLSSMSFDNVKVVYVPSDYKDLVLGVKSMGVPLRAGTMLPTSASIVLEVGEGPVDYIESDSLQVMEDEEWVEQAAAMEEV